MKKDNWLYDENGNVRKELRSLDTADIERKKVEIDANTQVPVTQCEFQVQIGDELLLAPQFRNEGAWGADWVIVVRVDRKIINGPSVHFLCLAPNGHGGFARADMFVGWRRPGL